MGILINKNSVFFDDRGKVVSSDIKFEEKTEKVWKDEIYSYSHKNVFRGFHGDRLTYKKITCLYGSIKFYAIDMFVGTLCELDLNDDHANTQMLIKPGTLIGFLCKSDLCIIHYKLSTTNSKFDKNQMSVSYKGIIDLPKDVILSQRDKQAKLFKEQFPQTIIKK